MGAFISKTDKTLAGKLNWENMPVGATPEKEEPWGAERRHVLVALVPMIGGIIVFTALCFYVEGVARVETIFQDFEQGNGTPGAYFENFWQTDPAFETGGSMYTYKIWTLSDSGTYNGYFYMGLSWYDGASQLISEENQIIELTDSWTQKVLQATAPSDAETVRVRFGGVNVDITGKFDDVEFYTLANPGFESGTNEDANNWTQSAAAERQPWANHSGDWGMAVVTWVNNGTGEAYQEVYITSIVYGGARSLKVVALWGGTVRINAASPTGYFDLRDATSLSAWVYDTQGHNPVQLRLRDSDGDGGIGDDGYYLWSSMPAQQNQWTKITWDISSYPSVPNLDIDRIASIELYEYNTGTYYFDNASFL